MAGLGELDEQIASAAADLRERDHVIHKAAELDQTLSGHRERIRVLSARLEREERDVERLEGLTVDRVLARLKGSLADDLERQQAERAAARYQLAEVQQQVDLVARERQRYAGRLATLAGVEPAFDAALAAKEEYLRESGDARATELLDLAEQRGQLEEEIREIDQALRAAADAEQALAAATEKLGSAGSWSTYDTWLGGGMVGSMIKHDRLDQAQRAASLAESRLAVLRSELADVGASDDVAASLGLDQTTRFVDIWFDNIVTDLAVGNRISKAKDSVRAAVEAVAAVSRRLRDRRAGVGDRLAAVAGSRETLLTGG